MSHLMRTEHCSREQATSSSLVALMQKGFREVGGEAGTQEVPGECKWYWSLGVRQCRLLKMCGGKSKIRTVTGADFFIFNSENVSMCFSVQFSCSVVSDSVTPCTPACQSSLSITSSQSLLKLMYIELVMSSKHLILCCPLLLPPSIFPSIRVFSNESALHIRWPKYWSYSFSISLSNEYSGLISFRMDWFDLLAVQGTLKSLLQHHSSKASVLQHSAFFILQLSHPCAFIYCLFSADSQTGKLTIL